MLVMVIVYVAQMYTTQYVGGDSVSVRGKQIVSVEKHLGCRCSCATKKEDCHELQEYDADSCRCRCLNMADEEKCRANNDTKVWDTGRCMCLCRQMQNCSSGYFYDLNTCSCSEVVEDQGQRVRLRSRISSQARGEEHPVSLFNKKRR
ncbi:hypothetical protein PR048_029771 [Dryococelus australis]|uniref:Uncharacterized protein n=1 Tax=Dryococelus australis TaxID=614101 RepID=A0ABQ9G712_9NEOP|nr:hypothetical protein PR048_029771 [Dryococelus australis]